MSGKSTVDDYLARRFELRKQQAQEAQKESPEPPKEEEISLGTDAARMAANSARYVDHGDKGSGSSDVTKLAKLLRKNLLLLLIQHQKRKILHQ